jgi:hypothetical protein
MTGNFGLTLIDSPLILRVFISYFFLGILSLGFRLIEDDLEVLVDLEQNGIAVILRNSDHVLSFQASVCGYQLKHERSGRGYLNMRHIC